MAKIEIDLVDTKTEGENHKREDTKPGILYDSTIVQNVPKAQFGCKVCPKSFQLVTDLLKHFKVHVHPETNNQKEQTFRDVTPNLECENEMNFDGTYDIIHKNQTNVQSEQSQNGLSISAKQFNPKENSSTSKESSTKTVKVKEQNICEICKKSFSRKSYLKLHVKTVHDEVKEYKCEICGKTFARIGNYKFMEKQLII